MLHRDGPAPGVERPRVPLPVLGVGLVLAYLPLWLPRLLRARGVEGFGPASTLVWNWIAVLLLVVFVLRIERLDLTSLRLTRPTEQDLTWAGILAGATMAWHWLVSLLLPPSWQAPQDGGAEGLVVLGPLVALAIVLTASVTEEVLWRGYVAERLGAWLGPIAGAAVGLAIFALGHLSFWGPGWLLIRLPAAAALYVLLLWRRNLWACILMHLITNSPIAVLAFLA